MEGGAGREVDDILFEIKANGEVKEVEGKVVDGVVKITSEGEAGEA